jgi:hypothetical protein
MGEDAGLGDSVIARRTQSHLTEKRNPMHDLIVAVSFVAVLLVPCVVAAFTGPSETTEA